MMEMKMRMRWTKHTVDEDEHKQTEADGHAPSKAHLVIRSIQSSSSLRRLSSRAFFPVIRRHTGVRPSSGRSLADERLLAGEQGRLLRRQLGAGVASGGHDWVGLFLQNNYLCWDAWII